MGREGIEAYRGYMRHRYVALLLLLCLLAAMAVVSLSAGSASLSVIDVLKALASHDGSPESIIVWNVRMPRVAAAIVVGAALAMSGCVMQAVLHNPLASSSTLGVSQGASFGAALAITCLGAGMQSGGSASLLISEPYMVTLFAFIGGISTTIVILFLSRLRIASPSVLVLAGVAISSTFSGATTLIQYFADDVMVASIVYWTFGNLGRAGWNEIAMIGAACVPTFVFFMLSRWDYNAIESGEYSARSLGVNVGVLVPLSLGLSALITSVSVSFTGCISFIGLIAPHVMRRIVGNDYRYLIPGSAICGAVLLLVADIACRMIISPVVLPIGALTSFVGAPLFLCLILRERRVG